MLTSGEKPTKNRSRSFFNDFKKAVNGEEKDFVTGSIRRAIFMLSVPMILEMVMESLFAVVDVYFVSQIGVEAIAAVGLTESVLAIVYSIAMGMSIAAMAMISRRTGEKSPDKAAEVTINAMALIVVVSLVLCLPGGYYAEEILQLMGAEEELITVGSSYTRWMLGGNITIMLLFMINAIFRGAGEAAVAMRVLWVSNGLNIFLDPLFIFGWGFFPAFGVTGAAMATNLSRGIGILYQLYVLWHLPIGQDFRRGAWKFSKKIMKRMVSLSMGSVGQFLLSSASWIFLARLVAFSGSEALAGYTIAIRIIIFTILPSWGVANAAATLVGQNLGAKQPDRASSSAWLAAFYNMTFLAMVTVVFFIWSDGFISIFNNSPAVIQYGTNALRIISLGYIFYAYEMVLGQCFNGAGDTKTPILINFVGYWLIQIPLAAVLSLVLGWGANGVFWAITISSVLTAALGIYLFRLGKWKLVEV